MKNKERYIELLRERTYLMETAWLYPSHYEHIEKINKEIAELKQIMLRTKEVD